MVAGDNSGPRRRLRAPKSDSPAKLERSIIGARIRAARLLLSLTQGQLGEMVGVSYQAIGKMEAGLLTAEKHLDALAKALNLPLSYFTDNLHHAIGGDERDDELVRLFLQISDPETRQRLLRVVKTEAALSEGIPRPRNRRTRQKPDPSDV